jgi:DNA polymerase-3 subunit gamma/tau
VYIIDEVHMLTKEAFNALLKTLEEPPAHVVFILATTEEEKLLDTILSRCQVFRMHSPSRQVLADTVTDVAKMEGFTLAPDAADLIAIAADGSFRDALGVTQKVILASGDTIGNADEVATIIGAPKSGLLRELIQSLHEKKVEDALLSLSKAVDSHVDMKLFSRLLLERIRAVILLRNAPRNKEALLKAFSIEDGVFIETLAKKTTTALNSHLLVALLSATENMGKTAIPSLPLELAIIDSLSK